MAQKQEVLKREDVSSLPRTSKTTRPSCCWPFTPDISPGGGWQLNQRGSEVCQLLGRGGQQVVGLSPGAEGPIPSRLGLYLAPLEWCKEGEEEGEGN